MKLNPMKTSISPINGSAGSPLGADTGAERGLSRPQQRPLRAMLEHVPEPWTIYLRTLPEPRPEKAALRFRLSALLWLAMVFIVPSLAAQTDEDSANRIGLSYRGGFNVKASYKNVG